MTPTALLTTTPAQTLPLVRRFAFGGRAFRRLALPTTDSTVDAVVQTAPFRAVFDKDVLRVGVWCKPEWARPWRVGPAVMQRLVDAFDRMRRHRVASYLVWNHSRDARDRVGRVLGLRIVGDRLVARLGVADPATAARLVADPDAEVSIEAVENFRDGAGRVYPLALTHVAIVQHPVVSGQEPFQRVLRLADVPSPSSPLPPKGTFAMSDDPLDVRAVVDAVNELLAAWNIPVSLPFDAAADELVDRLRELRDQGPGATPLAAAAAADPAAKLTALRHENDDLRRRLSTADDQRRVERFTAALDGLSATGRIIPAIRADLTELGRRGRWDLALLTPFERM
ncbi:MAG: hypothetical protein ACRC1K_05605, partial [Planctomycetia bacterium]